MPVNLLFHDTRLAGLTPSRAAGLQTFSVDESRPLSWFFDQCQRYARANGGINDLTIMAHGLEHESFGGGYGIVFCRENINNNTVGQAGDEATGIEPSGFGLLHDLVERIILYVCSAAAHSGQSIVTDSGAILDGDGFGICRRIAINAGATVVASSELQAYASTDIITPTVGSPDDPLIYCIGTPHEEPSIIDFGNWEGRVFTFDENGNVIDQSVYPSAWRDSRGIIHDPRELSTSSSGTTPSHSAEESWICPYLGY